MWPALHTHSIVYIKFHRSRMITRSKNEITVGRWWWWWWWHILYFNKLIHELQSSSGEFFKKIQFSFAHYTHIIFAQNRTLINLKDESVALHSHDAILLTLTYPSFSLSSLLQGTKTYHMTAFNVDAHTQITLWGIIFPLSLDRRAHVFYLNMKI